MNGKFMREAIRLSVQTMRRGQGGPFGAVVVRNGKIVGRGCNQVTSANDPTAQGPRHRLIYPSAATVCRRILLGVKVAGSPALRPRVVPK